MVAEPFSTGSSLFHRMDPRIKIVTALAFSVCIATAHQLQVLWLGALFSLMVAIGARLPIKPLFFRMLAVNFFVALVWLLVPFTTAGPPAFALGPLVATAPGTALAIELTFKTNTIVLLLTALLGTTTIFNLVHALDHLGVPQKLVQLFFFTWRYVHVVRAEFTRLANAMKIRCFAPSTGMHTYRTYAYLVGMLLVRSYDRSQRIRNAMLCRGFNGFFPAFRHFVLRPWEAGALGLMLSFVGLLGYLEWIV